MARYVVLFNWTDQGVKGAKQSVDRYERASEQFASLGIRFLDTHWTIGPYDIVSIVEAPDEETLSAALIALGSQGNVRSTTMRAFAADEMRGVIQRAP